jgi:hypothetical protein
MESVQPHQSSEIHEAFNRVPYGCSLFMVRSLWFILTYCHSVVEGTTNTEHLRADGVYSVVLAARIS